MVSATSSGKRKVIERSGGLPYQRHEFMSAEFTPPPSLEGTVLVSDWRQTMSTALILPRPGVMGGSPVIAGTRIRVSDIIRHQALGGGSVASIRRALPHLVQGQIKAALQYYQTHRAEIDAEVEAERGLAAQCQQDSA